VAFVFEVTRTLKDWLYLDFLKKRTSHGTTGRESPIKLQEVKQPQPHANGSSAKSSGISSEKQESNGGNGTTSGTTVPTSPVIATGTLSGSRKSCDRPAFHVGLLELSISTVFHVCQVVIGYILMLVVMTFNVWIFVAVLIGTGLGFFMFDGFNRKIRSLKFNAGSNSSSK